MKRIPLLLLFCLTSGVLMAQNYQIHNLSFLPPDYYVGDTVEMSFVLKTDQPVDLSSPETFPDPGWVRFLSIDIEPRGEDSYVVLRLIPYYPGTRALPPLDIGDLSLVDLKIFTSSILDSGISRELSEIRSPLLIPGTRAVGALLVSLLFSLPILLLFLYKVIRTRTVNIIRTYQLNLPYRRFQRLIRSIRRTMVSMPEKEFYLSFTGGLKKYLSTRFHQDLTSSTTSEIEYLLNHSRIHETLALSLINFFHRVDRVKFAGDKLLYSDREQLLGEVEDVSEALEDWRKKHADL
ncbi:hypothetical protein [Oceanispirochaeta sp.]|jgi:hypothetical protein|uniref:hypothetical protein n=1 Tax=Oceanispirochaeta sp. TaxID=2035350 RepID=UPI0026350741|nr:hypothetical protein [Oceanispirochaeta sp.]MDA3955842.1 hypothetical protein [Oceanispirochaeta sp.]